MPIRVLYDANVLYPNTVRDMLIRLAQVDLAQARWTRRILEEMERAIRRRRPDIESAKWGIEAWSPDEFVLDLIDLDSTRVWGCLQRIADSRRSPPEIIDDVLAQLERSGLIEATAALRAA